MTGVPGRFEAVDEGQPFTVLVDYAHTPEALENVLTEAREITAGRLVCVFGCGGDRDRSKRPLMGDVVAAPRRLGDRHVRQPAKRRPAGDHRRDPRRDVRAIPRSSPTARPRSHPRSSGPGEGDVVVIAGKGHEQGQEFADRIVPFDDREVVRETLRRLAARA